jgi:hypothetical protein
MEAVSGWWLAVSKRTVVSASLVDVFSGQGHAWHEHHPSDQPLTETNGNPTRTNR